MERLRSSEERYRAFITASSDVVYRMSADWSEMHSLRGNNFISDTDDTSRTWLETYIHPDDRAKVLTAINEAIRTKSPFELEHLVIRVDGSLGWAHSRAVPVFDEDGEILEWFGAAQDISERKRHQREADTRAFVGSPFRTLHPVKTLEQPRQLIGWNAGAGIGDGKLEPAVLLCQRYRDRAFERELKGVRKKIKDDLLPHINRLRERKAVYDQR